jgi:hypothetical protein
MNRHVGNETIANASFTSGLADSTGPALIVLLLLYVVGALLAAQFVAPWLARSELLSAIISKLFNSIFYVFKGLAVTAVLAFTALPVYFLATADKGTRSMALEAVGVLLAGYVALFVIGMLADRAVTAFIDAHPELDEWADIFSDEKEDTEAVADGGEEA